MEPPTIPLVAQFMRVIVEYNYAVEPMHYAAYLLGIIAILLAAAKKDFAYKYISLILAIFWLWSGAMFSMLYWSRVFPPAYIFGILFIIQGLLFLIFGFLRGDLSFSTAPSLYTTVGFIFIAYAMLIYPAIGYALDRGWPQSLPFGLVPCPTTAFTFGLLLWVNKKVPIYLFIIPLIMALFTLSAITLGIYEDIGVFITGVLGTILILVRNKKL